MELISEAFKQQLNSIYRNQAYVRVTFGVSNPDAPKTSDITDNGGVVFSQSDNIDLGLNISRTYETLEIGRCVLDGENELYDPDAPKRFTGFTSSLSSNDSGVWEVPPVITIDFGDNYFKFAGITIQFDTTMNNYASEFTLEAYGHGSKVYSKVHTPTNARYTKLDDIPECNKMVLTFTKSNVPNRRLRVLDIVYGITDTFDDTKMTQCQLKNETDVMSTSLPVTEFSFNIFDIDNRYDPDNPENLIQYLENGQSVKFELGWELDDGSVEWIHMYTGYTTGDVSVKDSGVAKDISIETISLLNSLDAIYDEQKWTGNQIDMYTLANNIINFVGYKGSLVLHENMKNYSTKVLLNGKSAKVALQLIANACGLALYTNRNGLIEFRDMMPEGESVHSFTRENMIQNPTTNRVPQIKTVTTKYYTHKVGEDVSNIAEIEVDSDVETEYSVSLTNNAEVNYTKSAGVTLVGDPTITANSFTATFKGKGTVTVKGKSIEVTENVITRKIHETGLDLEMTNELVDSLEYANKFIDLIVAYYSRRADYSFTNRGFPQLDCGDIVSVTTNYEADKKGTLYYNQIDYSGAITATSKVLEF